MIRLSDVPVHGHAYRFASPLLFALVLLASTVITQDAAAAVRKPNVILIFADDQGSVDVHCYGAKDLITPHLDAIAKNGVRFTQFYAAAPVCSPSRAGLLTGRVPQRAGVPGNAPSTRGQDGMPSEEVTIAEMLKQAGYVTGHVGKWHLGYTPATMPNGQGFDQSFGHMGGCIDDHLPVGPRAFDRDPHLRRRWERRTVSRGQVQSVRRGDPRPHDDLLAEPPAGR